MFLFVRFGLNTESLLYVLRGRTPVAFNLALAQKYSYDTQEDPIVLWGRFALSTESIFKCKEVEMFFTKSDFKG